MMFRAAPKMQQMVPPMIACGFCCRRRPPVLDPFQRIQRWSLRSPRAICRPKCHCLLAMTSMSWTHWHTSFQPNGNLHLGLSARLWWAVYLAWRQRWGRKSGMSWPLLSLMAVYVHACLFCEETIIFLFRLQCLIIALLPYDALAPAWLWWVLFGRHF